MPSTPANVKKTGSKPSPKAKASSAKTAKTPPPSAKSKATRSPAPAIIKSKGSPAPAKGTPAKPVARGSLLDLDNKKVLKAPSQAPAASSSSAAVPRGTPPPRTPGSSSAVPRTSPGSSAKKPVEKKKIQEPALTSQPLQGPLLVWNDEDLDLPAGAIQCCPGMKVVRGPDWSWGEQDTIYNNPSGVGDVRALDPKNKWATVVWGDGPPFNYRIGEEATLKSASIDCISRPRFDLRLYIANKGLLIIG